MRLSCAASILSVKHSFILQRIRCCEQFSERLTEAYHFIGLHQTGEQRMNVDLFSHNVKILPLR